MSATSDCSKLYFFSADFVKIICIEMNGDMCRESGKNHLSALYILDKADIFFTKHFTLHAVEHQTLESKTQTHRSPRDGSPIHHSPKY